MKNCLATIVAGALLGAAPFASAQQLMPAAERTIACLEVDGSEARLSCFEAAAAELSSALEIEEAAAAEPDWAQAPKPEPEKKVSTEADDGKPIWARIMPGQNEPDESEQINITVTKIMRNAAGRHFFLTADGQEWEQTMVEPITPPKTLPAEATIESSLLGNPNLSFDDVAVGRYKVKRVK